MRKLVSSGSPLEPRIGFSRAVRVGPIGAGTEAGVVIQAVRAFGPNGANEIPVAAISEKLPAMVKSEIKRLLPAAPVWAQPVLNRIVTRNS